MTGTPVFTSQAPPYFDHQVSGMFGECERMAYYLHQLGRRPNRTTTALDWGATFHGCVDIIIQYEGLKGNNLEIIANLCRDFIKERMMEDDTDRYGRTPERMWEALMTWIDYQRNNPIEILRSEQPTIIRCDSGESCPYFPDREKGCDLEYGGIMDAIVNWIGYIGPLDRKTTVMTDKDPVNEYLLSHQMMGYDWIASHLMGRHCWGAIVERVITNKSKIEIGRFPIPFSASLIQEWVENERVLQSDYKFKAENYPFNENMWRQNRARCWEPYACQFRDVCLAPVEGGFRQRFLRDNTVEKRWDFMNRDEK